MKALIQYIQQRVSISESEIKLLHKYFISEQVAPNTILLEAGKTENYISFLNEGIVKGYQNIDGKIIVQHLVSEHDFFTSLDSFRAQVPAQDYYQTITACSLFRVSKKNFDLLQEQTNFWSALVKEVTDEHLNCKLDRVKDFQILTAKQRYEKFIAEHPKLALNVSIENMASFLGMEPQSLSRIRKQLTF